MFSSVVILGGFEPQVAEITEYRARVAIEDGAASVRCVLACPHGTSADGVRARDGRPASSTPPAHEGET
ncbi:hypothetical protein EVAR_22500_1 [Eumeta japonica]|uniref:Uncharacterized protein n=1 Tax=Eumeta variegata TaxID=151549 RepID=A0A4C1ZEV8_EUMVA|nr:hypothetical protein EVAR_22500_1 [Eumeta japonica]